MLFGFSLKFQRTFSQISPIYRYLLPPLAVFFLPRQQLIANWFFQRSRKLKPTHKAMAGVAVIAALTMVGMSMSWNSATAQQKKPVTPDLVRNIDEPGFNPYEHSQNITVGPVSATASFPIPTNEVVVIEHVSLSGGLQGDGVVQAFIRCSTTSDASQEVNHSLVLVPQGENESNGFKFYSASQPIKCYASSTGTLTVHVQTGTIQSTQPIWVMAVSGYTVPQ
jgi:hypothetical protein